MIVNNDKEDETLVFFLHNPFPYLFSKTFNLFLPRPAGLVLTSGIAQK
jgi:hypothetical protein